MKLSKLIELAQTRLEKSGDCDVLISAGKGKNGDISVYAPLISAYDSLKYDTFCLDVGNIKEFKNDLITKEE